MNAYTDQTASPLHELGKTLLQTGSLLMRSGANTERIKVTLSRIGKSFDVQVEVAVSYSSIYLSVANEDGAQYINLVKIPYHRVNFKMVSGISRLSWQVVENNWTVSQINKELNRLAALPFYPRWITIGVVGLAGAGFCQLAGGSWQDIVVVYLATVIGTFVLQTVLRKEFNPYLCVFFASLTASIIAGIALKAGAGHMHEIAFATSVLFLIPGVPLINSFSDLIDGNIQNAIIRGIHGFVISFVIALGLLTSLLICQL